MGNTRACVMQSGHSETVQGWTLDRMAGSASPNGTDEPAAPACPAQPTYACRLGGPPHRHHCRLHLIHKASAEHLAPHVGCTANTAGAGLAAGGHKQACKAPVLAATLWQCSWQSSTGAIAMAVARVKRAEPGVAPGVLLGMRMLGVLQCETEGGGAQNFGGSAGACPTKPIGSGRA